MLDLRRAMATLYQFIIYRRNFVLEPYRGKAVNDSTFFYRKIIDKTFKQILTQFSEDYELYIYKEESQIRILIVSRWPIWLLA